MTAAPPIPGLHTVIVDPRLVIAGEPLFSVESPMTILGVTPWRWHPSGHVEFRVLVGVKKLIANNLDQAQHGH